MLTPGGPVVEVAVDSVAAAEMAAELGVDRLELCQSLEAGGLTPSLGLIESVRAVVGRPVMVMIRVRAGDFVYAEAEIRAMLRDVAVARTAGADGIVFGGLDHAGAVDRRALDRVIAAAGPVPVTFHRAFDLVARPMKALEQLIDAGVRRVLTSGGATTAFEGRTGLARYVKRAGRELTVIAGGGVVGEHVVDLIGATGVSEIHLSGSYQVPGSGGALGFGLTTVPNPARLLRVLEALGRPVAGGR